MLDVVMPESSQAAVLMVWELEEVLLILGVRLRNQGLIIRTLLLRCFLLSNNSNLLQEIIKVMSKEQHVVHRGGKVLDKKTDGLRQLTLFERGIRRIVGVWMRVSKALVLTRDGRATVLMREGGAQLLMRERLVYQRQPSPLGQDVQLRSLGGCLDNVDYV